MGIGSGCKTEGLSPYNTENQLQMAKKWPKGQAKLQSQAVQQNLNSKKSTLQLFIHIYKDKYDEEYGSAGA